MYFVTGTFALAALLVLSQTLHAETAILECTADTWVSSADLSAAPAGRSRELLLDQARRIVLLDFRLAAAERWRITKATLLLHAQGIPPGKVGVSTVSTGWSESEATFLAPHVGRLWTTLGSDFRDAIFGRAGSRYTFSKAVPYQAGWIQIDVDPTLIDWLLEEKGHGLALLSLGLHPIRLSARETVGTAPYLLLEGRRK